MSEPRKDNHAFKSTEKTPIHECTNLEAGGSSLPEVINFIMQFVKTKLNLIYLLITYLW